jgi:FkbM family methyltransferase
MRRSVTLDGCTFSLAGSPDYVRYLLISGKYESAERGALKTALISDLPAVEFGAGIGVISCLTNKILKYPDRHVVVEANSTLLALLKSHRLRNKCEFKILNKALAYDRSSVEFTVDDNFLLGRMDLPGNKRVRVQTTTLLAVLDHAGFDACNLICDIEGAECDLVENELEILKTRVACIMMETHPAIRGEEAVSRMMDKLGSSGFKAVAKDGTTYVLQQARLGGRPDFR